VDKQGRRKDYSSAYLRRTFRDGGKVKNETVANLSALPGHVIDLIDAGLKGQQLVPAPGAVTITGSLPHGHGAAVAAMAAKLGLPALGPARRSAAAQAKASCQHDPAGQPYRSFRGLLDHLATLTRNQVRYTGIQVTIAMLAEPTSTQRQAFELIGAPIPLTLR